MQKGLNMKLLYGEKQLRGRILELADEIMASYSNDDASILCICVLRGAVMFFSDLVKAMASDRIIFDFIRLSSYEKNASTGKVKIEEDMCEDPAGKHVLIIEDIIDSGITVQFLRQYFSRLGQIDVKVACLLDRPSARIVNECADYSAFVLRSSAFLVGYGLDYGQSYRNLNGIFEVIE